MTDLTLTKIRFSNGKWEGRLDGASETGARPDILVTLLDKPVEGVQLNEGDTDSVWNLTIPIPSHAVAEGVQTFLILDGAADRKLGDFTMIAGDVVADDLRAEVDLLRAELDMLKRAFRRHCLETM